MQTPGKRNRRICIQSNTGMSGASGGGCATSVDEFGEPIDTWNTVYECWAAMNFTTGKQIYSTAQFTTKTAYNIEVLWNPNFVFQPDQRVVYKEQSSGVTHTYVIESISNPDQANKTVVILAYELGAAE